MTALELIEKLKTEVEEHGNLRVIFFDGTTREYVEVDLVNFRDDHFELEYKL